MLEENERLKQDPLAAVPEAVDYRCIQTIKRGFAKERRHTVGRITYRVLNRVAMIAVMCALLFVTAFAASSEIRSKTINLLIEVSDTFSTLTLRESQMAPNQTDFSDLSTETMNLLCGYHFPNVPEGFTVEYQGGGQSSGYIQYINADGATILFDIFEISDGDEYIIDTEDAELTNMRIHGYEGLLVEKQNEFDSGIVVNSIDVVWGDTDQSKFILIRGYNVDIVKNNNICDEICVGDIITFISDPEYFGDGYIMPIVGLSKGNKVYLNFDVGYKEYMSYLYNR